MVKQVELFNVQYKEGSLEPKTAELIKFAVNLAIDHEHGAKLHLGRAREVGATEDGERHVDPRRGGPAGAGRLAAPRRRAGALR